MTQTLVHATAIVVAYLERHEVPLAELLALIIDARSGAMRDAAVPFAESITPDWLISLETGRRLKVLEKHLQSFDPPPDACRARWGLPADCPMAAPNHGAWRSAYGRVLGRGELAPVAGR